MAMKRLKNKSRFHYSSDVAVLKQGLVMLKKKKKECKRVIRAKYLRIAVIVYPLTEGRSQKNEH